MSATGRREGPLLQEFDKTAALAKPLLVDRYGDDGADALYRDARENYRKIIPQIPWVKGARAPAMNAFLRGTAQEIAVYQAVDERGGTAPEAWEICHEANRLRINAFPRWKRWLLRRFMFSRPVRWIARRREDKNELVRVGDFEIRYVTGDGNDFDVGVDYVRCGNLELAKKLGAEAFAPYVCMSDIALSDALGWGLTRTQTLADGCSHCDFRFKKGGETCISSKTPEVQQTIDKNRWNESVEYLGAVMPEYEARMVKKIAIHAPPARVFDALVNLKVSDMPMAKFLGAVRTLGQSAGSAEKDPLLIEEVARFGWIPLLEAPGRQLITGLVAQVWRRDFGVADIADRDAFVRFDEPGFAKIVVSHRFEPNAQATHVISETRVHTTDPRSARRFRWYWRAIRLGAGLTVRSGLRAIKRLAEAV